MGRHDFRPRRVHETATRLLQAERITQAPAWLQTVGNIPPAQTLVRTQPTQHYQHRRSSKARKPSKLFQPQRITYEEDALRKQFFSDHPWELARPRVVLENDGRDAERQDWSEGKEDWSGMGQVARNLDGESVVQRQMWLMHNVPGMTVSKAYDKARKEFYELRLQEEVEQRVAKEEAQATGAHFGKSMLQIGMELEDQTYEKWKVWATKNAELIVQRNAAMYTGVGGDDELGPELGDAETEAGLEEVMDGVVPAKGQEAYGGAMARP